MRMGEMEDDVCKVDWAIAGTGESRKGHVSGSDCILHAERPGATSSLLVVDVRCVVCTEEV
jgi:hypothetical protein